MIPTYNNGRFLGRTLASVLRQDPGANAMQIEVVDGCSTEGDAEQITKEVGNGRVGFHRLDCNHGAAHTFNVCIERSCGHWVHILHGDDMVMPGYYEAYAKVIRANREAQMVLGQILSIDEEDRWLGVLGPTPPVGGGIITDFVERLTGQQIVQFPGVIVRRDSYEKVGGFCTLFHHVVDWDMWFRIGQLAPVACVSHPYGLYRIHSGSETSRLRVSAANIREPYFLMKTNVARLNGSGRALDERAWCTRWADEAERMAWLLDRQNCFEGRYNQARWAWMLEPNMRRLILLVKSWLKQQLKGKPALARPGLELASR
jgi:GT2 family glycosyltransferase